MAGLMRARRHYGTMRERGGRTVERGCLAAAYALIYEKADAAMMRYQRRR